jgi:hypothetical protein
MPQNHSSRRKPVQVWSVCATTEEDQTITLFWYKKDAEQYMIDYANLFAADDIEPQEFRSFGKAYRYLNSEAGDSWELSQVTVHNVADPYQKV